MQSAAFVAAHDAPRIGERADAAQRKVAMSTPVKQSPAPPREPANARGDGATRN